MAKYFAVRQAKVKHLGHSVLDGNGCRSVELLKFVVGKLGTPSSLPIQTFEKFLHSCATRSPWNMQCMLRLPVIFQTQCLTKGGGHRSTEEGISIARYMSTKKLVHGPMEEDSDWIWAKRRRAALEMRLRWLVDLLSQPVATKSYMYCHSHVRGTLKMGNSAHHNLSTMPSKLESNEYLRPSRSQNAVNSQALCYVPGCRPTISIRNKARWSGQFVESTGDLDSTNLCVTRTLILSTCWIGWNGH